MLAIVLQACVGTGGGSASLEEPSVVPVTVIAGETITEGSDDRIILSTVVAAPVSGSTTIQLPWVNRENGDSGSVSVIRETDEGQSVCRNFTVSKQSYDGISQMSGKACRAKTGVVWTLQSLEPGK
jgi:surface antigen